MKKKLLIIPAYNLYPYTNGSSMAQMTFIEALRHDLEISILITPDSISKKNLEKIKQEWPEVKFIMLCDNVIKTKSFDINTMGYILKLLLRVYKKNLNKEKTTYPLPSYNAINKQFIKELNSFLAKNTFDLIQVELAPNIELINVLPKQPFKIFVNHEIIYQRYATEYNERKLNCIYSNYLLENIGAYEKGILDRYDAIFCFSEENKNLLINKLKIKPPVYVSPYPIFNSEITNTFEHNSKYFKLVFSGSENHYPNKAALIWILKHVIPTLNRYKIDIQLKITGNWTSKFRKQYSSIKNIEFIGFVEDYNKLLYNAIVLAPINIGSGLRTKILMAMAKGVPVISTPFACEGIHATHKKNILIANSHEEFYQCIISLLSDKELRRTISHNAIKHIITHFKQSVLAKKRLQIYENILHE